MKLKEGNGLKYKNQEAMNVTATRQSTAEDAPALLQPVDRFMNDGSLQVFTADRVRARIAAEGTNGPLTPWADHHLQGRGTVVIPDLLADAGGVIVSYIEWQQGLQLARGVTW